MRNILKGTLYIPVHPCPTQAPCAILDLMAENHVLRGFLRSLSEFIGDGAGGLLTKIGWSMQDFENFVNKSETDTAYESFQRRKREGQPTTSSASQTASRKRASEDETANNPKRARGHSERDDADRSTDAFPVLMPMNSVPSGSNLYSRSSQDASLFSDIMRGPNGSPILLPGPSSPSYPTSSSQVPQSNGSYQNSYVTPLNMGVETSAINSISFLNNATTPTIPQQSRPSVASLDELEPIDPKNVEAQKLISFVAFQSQPLACSPSLGFRYHLDNYKRNSAYCLPASLRPTLVQRYAPSHSLPSPGLTYLSGRFPTVHEFHPGFHLSV